MGCGANGYPNPTSSCRPMEAGLGKLFAFMSGVTSKNQWKHNMRDDHDECPSTLSSFRTAQGRSRIELSTTDGSLAILLQRRDGCLAEPVHAVWSPVHSLEAIENPFRTGSPSHLHSTLLLCSNLLLKVLMKG